MSRRRDLIGQAAFEQQRQVQSGICCEAGAYEWGIHSMKAPCSFRLLFRIRGFDGFQDVVMDTRGDAFTPRVDVRQTGHIDLFSGSQQTKIVGQLDTLYDIVFSCSEKDTRIYVNNVLTTVHNPVVYSWPFFSLGKYSASSSASYFNGDIYSASIFDYPLTAPEIAKMWNNGDPQRYVLPHYFKDAGNSYQSDFSAGADAWSKTLPETTVAWNNGVLEVSSTNTIINTHRWLNTNLLSGHWHNYRIEVELYGHPKLERIELYPFSGSSHTKIYLSEATQTEDGIRLTGTMNQIFDHNAHPVCYFYLFGVVPGTVIRVKSIKITPVGCIHEYVPQNLTSKSWYDSAKCLPLGDEYLPPLHGSMGGFDLAANGVPQILLNNNQIIE